MNEKMVDGWQSKPYLATPTVALVLKRQLFQVQINLVKLMRKWGSASSYDNLP